MGIRSSSWHSYTAMESHGTSCVSREFKTESISAMPSELPSSDISSRVYCASLPAAAIWERKSPCCSPDAADSNPAAGASPRSIRASNESFAGGFLSIRAACFLEFAITPLQVSRRPADRNFCLIRYNTTAMASSSGNARRYWRSEARASRQSTAARMRAPSGISSPAKPSG